MNLDRLYTIHNIDLNIKLKTTKLPEDKVGGNIDDIRLSKDILDTTSKAWSIKQMIDKLDIITIKICHSVRDTTKWEDKPQTGRKYLQEISLIKDCYSKYPGLAKKFAWVFPQYLMEKKPKWLFDQCNKRLLTLNHKKNKLILRKDQKP